MVLAVLVVGNGIDPVAEYQALLGVLAVLYHPGGHGFPVGGSEIGGGLAAPEPLGDGPNHLAGDMGPAFPLTPVVHWARG